ncbi:hypothetical protein SAMN06269185_0053 [Natronoarchaeum philippinense]|uniref:Cytochrome C oxidase subunit I n=1 Tax=Natronoarchaeum philippinense TaxID=558529 RepID=A0A285N0W1_NATPI|nr:DUF6789 family protein [Natronoarchaeum philippinense]SNZ02563.1 hypothetical protein SAMN06269185_0053 [Natronoarchaeum philippinense]
MSTPDERPDLTQPTVPGDIEDLEARLDINARVVLSAFAGGLAGLIAMTPVLLGLPALLGLFEADPLVSVTDLGRVIGVQPSLLLGLAVFLAGGVIALPLLFTVAGAFLPPREPRAARGIVFATIMWTGFVIAYRPGPRNVVLFAALSLAGHWVYGYALGAVMERLAYIPEHTI